MKSFLQSNKWADLQKSLGREIWRIEDNNIIRINLPLNKNYLYSPRCGDNFLSDSFLRKVKEIAKNEKAIFLKVEPASKLKDLKEIGFIKSHDIQPIKTLILDLVESEEKLLKNMHQKTRYNIRLAGKKGIKIKKDKKEFEDFWKLIQKTTKRDKFSPHPKEYYKQMLETSDIELFVAVYKDKIIAANIILFYNKQTIYLHGASDYEYRNLMASYLLQWHQILEAKRRGCVEYDFWGIDENRWPGVTRFKKGFGGKEIKYPGAYDLVFQPLWYGIYKITRKVL
jgi:lipid II:glycine glycyltransferase (peptidoglycan interpeptide bridge formation enzyme)